MQHGGAEGKVVTKIQAAKNVLEPPAKPVEDCGNLCVLFQNVQNGAVRPTAVHLDGKGELVGQLDLADKELFLTISLFPALGKLVIHAYFPDRNHNARVLGSYVRNTGNGIPGELECILGMYAHGSPDNIVTLGKIHATFCRLEILGVGYDEFHPALARAGDDGIRIVVGVEVVVNINQHINSLGRRVIMQLLLTTMVGLEEIVADELKSMSLRAEKLRNGRVLAEGEEKDVILLNYMGRTFERVHIVLDIVENVQTLDDVYRAVRNVDLREYINPKLTFACRSDRMGEHSFTSLDIERTAGQAVVDYFAEIKGERIRANLTDPDVIVRVDLDQNTLYISIDTTGYEALHRRGYRVYDHPAALNAALASAMIRTAGWTPQKSILDPFAGGGTIPIEAALLARRMPWFRFRGFLLERQPFIDPYDVKDIRRELASNISPEIDVMATGVELYKKHVKGFEANARSACVFDTITIKQGDARQISEEVDVIVTNPPYGQRIANPRVVRELYYEFTKRAADIGVPTVVTITSRWKWMEDALQEAGYGIEKSKFVLYGKLHTHLIRARLR